MGGVPSPKVSLQGNILPWNSAPNPKRGRREKKAHWAFVSGKECEEARVCLLHYLPVAPPPVSLPALTISGEAALTATAPHLPSRH